MSLKVGQTVYWQSEAHERTIPARLDFINGSFMMIKIEEGAKYAARKIRRTWRVWCGGDAKWSDRLFLRSPEKCKEKE